MKSACVGVLSIIELLSGFFHVVVGGGVGIVGNTVVQKLGRRGVAFGGEEQSSSS